jgi:hypothetical protein
MRDIVRAVEPDWERQLGAERFADLRELLRDLNRHVTDGGRRPAAGDS